MENAKEVGFYTNIDKSIKKRVSKLPDILTIKGRFQSFFDCTSSYEVYAPMDEQGNIIVSPRKTANITSFDIEIQDGKVGDVNIHYSYGRNYYISIKYLFHIENKQLADIQIKEVSIDYFRANSTTGLSGEQEDIITKEVSKDANYKLWKAELDKLFAGEVLERVTKTVNFAIAILNNKPQ